MPSEAQDEPALPGTPSDLTIDPFASSLHLPGYEDLRVQALNSAAAWEAPPCTPQRHFGELAAGGSRKAL